MDLILKIPDNTQTRDESEHERNRHFSNKKSRQIRLISPNIETALATVINT